MSTVEKSNEVSPLIIEPALPPDPALRLVADEVLAKLRYSFVTAAADEQITAPGRLDATFQAFLATRSAPGRARFRERGQALFNAPSPVRAAQLGRYAALQPKEYRTVGSDAIASRLGKLPVNGDALKESIRQFSDRLVIVPKLSNVLGGEHKASNTTAKQAKIKLDPDVFGGLMFKKMRLYINKVRCKEETDEVGSDEINLGGTVTDPFGSTSMVNQFKVSHDFDEGESVTFNPGKVFATWNIATKPDGFPYVYAAVIAMSEKDDGGFYKFLRALWEKIDEEVKTAIAGAVGAAVGGILGSIIPGIGTVAGMFAGFLLGVFMDWLLSDNPDDIVAVKTVLMTLASTRKSYYDWARLTSAEGWTTTLHFKGDGGRYDVDLAYKVSTE